jgi:transcriptional regulator with XRE-family HTH domain
MMHAAEATMTIREKLQRLLDLHNTAAVARRAGIHPESLRSILKGRFQPSRETTVALADALKIDVGWLADDRRTWPPIRVERDPVGSDAA